MVRSKTRSQHNGRHAKAAVAEHDGRTAVEVEIPSPDDLIGYAKQYASERPAVVALWCLGIGFVLGWKLKPW